MKTSFSVVLALVAVSVLGATAEAHPATGTHLMWINAPKSSPPYAMVHKNADCPNPPAGVK